VEWFIKTIITEIKMQKLFEKNRYCIVKDAISKELRDFVTQYALFDEMQNLKLGDLQAPNSHSKYADPTMETMLLHLHSIVEKNTGLSLYPTYSYHRVYRPGDDLKKHKDRPSCEISATLCFNYSYDTKKYQWPIYMNNNKVNLKPGDLVIYKGCELEHFRDVFDIQEEAWHVQGFFHYVDKNGPYKDFKFDKRKTIGENNNKSKNTISKKPYIINT